MFLFVDLFLIMNNFKIIIGNTINISNSLDPDQVCRGYEHATKVVKGKRLQNQQQTLYERWKQTGAFGFGKKYMQIRSIV